MAMLRRAGPFNEDADPLDQPDGGPPTPNISGMGPLPMLGVDPSFPSDIGGPPPLLGDRRDVPPGNRGSGLPLNKPQSNKQSPLMRDQGQRMDVPPVSLTPSTLASPPSLTQRSPAMSLPSPQPESMVFPSMGGSKLFGASGGQSGGGLNIGGDSGEASNNPSSLIMSLLQLLGNR